MSTLIRTLSTGHVIVFDKERRDLYIAEPGNKCDSIQGAKKLVAENKARRIDRNELATLQHAINEVILLAPS